VGGAGLEGTISCGGCSTLSRVTNENTVCVLASTPALHAAAARATQSYEPTEFSGFIPPVYTPRLTSNTQP
jgi:hypothetical protein